MTKVIPLARLRAVPRVQTPAPQANHPTSADHAVTDKVTRKAAIENALAMALYFLSQPGNSAANMWAATARANRALTLLKQASEGNALASPSNTTGRA